MSFQSFLCARQCCVNEVLFIQGPFDKIQGLLGKTQGLFKDLNNCFSFQGLFKGWCFFKNYSKPVRTMYNCKNTWRSIRVTDRDNNTNLRNKNNWLIFPFIIITCPAHSLTHLSRLLVFFFSASLHCFSSSFSVQRMLRSTSHSHAWCIGTQQLT